MPYRDGFAGVFRMGDTALLQHLHTAFSCDGIHWEITKEPIKFISEDEEMDIFVRGFDPSTNLCKS